jgi:hypothetical protein
MYHRLLKVAASQPQTLTGKLRIIRVKGKTRPLELLEVLVEPSEQRMAVARRYDDAWRKYALGDFAEAAAGFDELRESDHPSSVLARVAAAN